MKPQERNLSGIYTRIKRDGKYQTVDLTDMTPDWGNYDHKFCGAWDLLSNRLFFHPIMTAKQSTIYFRTKEDIEESFKKHPEEWKTYLFYNQ